MQTSTPILSLALHVIRDALRAIGPAQFMALAAALALLSGCAPHRYMGVSLRPGEAPAGVQYVAQQAKAGDKYAQLRLGLMYHYGMGVPRDLKRARKLYTLSATDSGGQIWVYSPPVGKEGHGRVIPVNTGPRQKGLEIAKSLLRMLPDD